MKAVRRLCLLAGWLAAWALTGVAAAEPCRHADQTWDASCLRRQYQGPVHAWPPPAVDAGVAWQEWGPIPPLDVARSWLPDSAVRSPLARDIARREIRALGARLFAEPRLSRSGRIACASCHQPQRALGDGRPLAVGEDGLMGRRRSMPLYGAPFAPLLFWDGRANDLWQQVLMPISDPREMNHDVASATSRLAALPEFQTAFSEAFGETGVSAAKMARALAAHVASLRPPVTRFDAFIAGDNEAYTDQEVIGLHLFRNQARCMQCHHGPLLTDQRFHNIGLSFLGRRNQDLGRYEFTRDPADAGTFRTPSLRQVAQAGPWMHNGIFPRLDGLLRMYNAGMPPDAPAVEGLRAPKSPLILPLSLDADELQALEAFLRTL